MYLLSRDIWDNGGSSRGCISTHGNCSCPDSREVRRQHIVFLLTSSMINQGISKQNVTLHRFREGHLPKTSIESTSLPQKENGWSHSRETQLTPTGTVFSLALFRENYHLEVLGSKKIYSRGTHASVPCGRNLLEGTRSSSSALACQEIFQGFS